MTTSGHGKASPKPGGAARSGADVGLRRPQEDPDADVRRALAVELRWLTHEISQPLAAIVSYVRGAQLRLDNRSLKEADLANVLEAIATQAQRAVAIVRGADRQRGS
ncbi:MAG: hypothetical protein IT294_08825 [Deltaproteobacteria bacterium]|nr:hypothetical protein [Deltaproteobacteria bacterium]